MPEYIKKRDGRLVPYDEAKIAAAIDRAFVAAESGKGEVEAERLAKIVTREMNAKENNETPSVEDIQDQVEQVLIAEGYAKTAKAYILYRAERSRTREAKTRLMHILEDITFKDASESDVKRENANIDGDTAMGTMLKYGSESAKQFYDMYVLNPKHARAHREGDIHIHDLDFLSLTTTCCQIDIKTLFKQNLIFRFLPRSVFDTMAFDKESTFVLGNSMKKLDFSGRVRGMRCPVLIICGEKDRSNIRSAQYLSQNIPGAELQLIEHTGHVVNEENPKALAERLNKFYSLHP